MPKKYFKNVVQEAREAAVQVLDPVLRAETLVAIAIVSDDPDDLCAINESIEMMGKGEMRAAAVTAIVRRLAIAKRFKYARELLMTIPAGDNFWRAEACAYIGLFSGKTHDFGQAKMFAFKIHDKKLRGDLLETIERFEHDSERSIKMENKQTEEKELATLVKALAKVGDYEKAHKVARGLNLAHVRALALASLAKILAEAIK